MRMIASCSVAIPIFPAGSSFRLHDQSSDNPGRKRSLRCNARTSRDWQASQTARTISVSPFTAAPSYELKCATAFEYRIDGQSDVSKHDQEPPGPMRQMQCTSLRFGFVVPHAVHKKIMVRCGQGLCRRRGCFSDSDFATAFLALVINKVQVVVAFVQKALFPALEAICTDPMNWLVSAYRVFYDISNSSGTDALKFIAILLCGPCLELGYLFFKVAFTLQQIDLWAPRTMTSFSSDRPPLRRDGHFSLLICRE
jgi:hypothetical protein